MNTKRPLTMCLVDDDADDASLFEEVLQEVDPAVRFLRARDGQEALDMLQTATHLPDLIFLDLNMPRLDGKECLKELKSEARWKDIPVVIYTTSAQSKDIEETMLSGATCFITKPSSMKELKFILSSFRDHVPHDLKKALVHLSNSGDTFIIC